jgi:hypothetical protein
LACSSEVKSAEKRVSCGVLEDYRGEVQILDEQRLNLVQLEESAVVPCRSWIFVDQGWMQIRYSNGFRVQFGSQTLVQLLDLFSLQKDHFVLSKGTLYLDLRSGEKEVRVASSVARMRASRGKFIILARKEQEDTQLITLSNVATLENRFEPHQKVRVSAGEMSEMNFKLMRVIPLPPSAISLASLRSKMNEFQFVPRDRTETIREVLKRQKRNVVAELKMPSQPSRKIASIRMKKNPSQTYLRNASDSQDAKLAKLQEAKLNVEWVKRLAGGAEMGKEVLFPSQFNKKPGRAGVEVVDLSQGVNSSNQTLDKALNQSLNHEEEQEKKHLIEDLSRIRLE